MALSADVLVRIGAMLNCGQIHSEPESLSDTDIMLDRLQARRRRSTSSPQRLIAAGVSPARPRAGEIERHDEVNWLDLPSVAELMQARRRLL